MTKKTEVNLTQEDLDKVHRYLEDKRKNWRCSTCDRMEWAVDAISVELPTQSMLQVVAVPIVCKNCGQIIFFSAKMMGIVT